MDTSSQTNSSGYEKLSLLLLNINGLRNKTDDIRQIIAHHQLHVLALCETNLDSTVKDSQVYIKGFRMWRRDRGSNGGGVALYVQDHIETRLRSDLIKTRVEMIWVEMKLPGSKPILLGCFYRTKENLKHLVQIHERMIELSKEKQEKDILLMGDFNIHWSHNQDNVAVYFSSKWGLSQIVTDDTRYDKNSSSCIDHIYTNIPDRCSRPKSTETLISDHNLVTVKVRRKVPKWIRMCRSNCFRPKEFKKAIEGSSWKKVYKAADPKEALSKFTKIFLSVADEHAPLQNQDIYGLLRSDDGLERSLSEIDQVTRSEFNRDHYGVVESEEGTPLMDDMTESSSEGEEAEQEVEDLIIKKQEKYFQQQIEEIKDCPEKLLTVFKACLDECLPSHVISIKPEGDVTSETEHLENLHPTNTETSDSDSDSSSEGSPSKKRRPEAFRFEDTDPETVKRLLEHFCDRVVCGIDQTEAEMMKLAVDQISAPISHILNKVISKEVFPDELKKPQKCSYNYVHFRQISSADRIHIMLGFIFDMILYLQTKDFFTKKQLIPSLDIMETLESLWLRVSEANQKVGAVFLDFSSSFNTISHDPLMNKLRTSGFSASALSLIKRFLSYHEGSCGLPPGSFLAKLLFTFYINDLVNSKQPGFV